MSENLRRAVVVGVGKYKSKTEELPDLLGAENDAKEIWTRLINPEIGGFDQDKSYILTGKDATCEKIRTALSDVFYKADACDIGLFYFSGHGREIDCYGEGYIAPYDMLYDDPIVYGIKMSEIRQILSASFGQERVNNPISILDCCYSGISTIPAKGGKPAKTEAHLDIPAAKGVIQIASSGKDQESTEILNAHKDEMGVHAHGALTFYLLKGLDGEAPGENAQISVDSLFTYARDQLEKPPRRQIAEISLGASTGADRVLLARISIATRKLIDSKILELGENYKSDPSCVIYYSVPRVAYVLRYNKKHKLANDFKEKIEIDLQKFEHPKKWFVKHYLDIRAILPNVAQTLHSLLVQRAFEPNFGALSSLKQDTLTLLTFVYCESEAKTKDADNFIKLSRDFEKPKTALIEEGLRL